MIIPARTYTLREYSVVKVLEKHKVIGKRILNVGFKNYNHRSKWWIDIAIANNLKRNALEAFQNNVNDAKMQGMENIERGDFCDMKRDADILLFWH
jgi:hypothetical protein